jgi:hypothetical protein
MTNTGHDLKKISVQRVAKVWYRARQAIYARRVPTARAYPSNRASEFRGAIS